MCKNRATRCGAYNYLFASPAARGKNIGAGEMGNGIWNLYYRDVLLGHIGEKLIDKKETYLHIKKIKV